MSNNIFIAAHARSGSTFLCQLMQQISEIKVYYEIFHFHHSEIMQHLHGDYPDIARQLRLSDNEAQARRSLIQQNHEYLAALQKINKNRMLAFKVFPRHLPDESLRQVVSESRLVVILRRNLLQSYISTVIARNIQKWGRIDTSEEKALFSGDDFSNHVQTVTNYYKSVIQTAENQRIKVVYVDYESVATAHDPAKIIISTLSNGLGYQLHYSTDAVKITKQDKRCSAVDKVLNATEMMKFLDSHKLTVLNDGNTNCTDVDYARIS